MWRGAGQVLNWLACHLVAAGFLAFLVVAVTFRGALFGLSGSEATEDTPGSGAVAGARGPHPATATSEEQLQVVEPAATSSPGEGAGEQQVHPIQPAPGFRPLSAEEREAAKQQPSTGKMVPQRTTGTPSRLRPLDEDEIRLPAGALLKRAREAFWDGQPKKAEALYLRYLQMRPDDANGFGELGNLYQSMGRTRDALDAYYEAGVRLRADGDRKQLAQVIEWLEKAGDPRARLLSHD